MRFSGPSLEEQVVHVIRAGRGAAYFSVQSSYRATTLNLALKSGTHRGTKLGGGDADWRGVAWYANLAWATARRRVRGARWDRRKRTGWAGRSARRGARTGRTAPGTCSASPRPSTQTPMSGRSMPKTVRRRACRSRTADFGAKGAASSTSRYRSGAGTKTSSSPERTSSSSGRRRRSRGGARGATCPAARP